MTTTTPIPTSIATASAAHDRHRLDVLDALLDEAAPTAVRELLGAALDLCATLRADRDEREAAIGATFARHRAEIDAATSQLAAARQVIDEERATVAWLTARVAELEARPVLTVERLDDALQPVLFGTGDRAKIAAAAMAKLGPVTLPAQDRAEELARAYGIEAAAVTGSRRDCGDSMRRALASLGAPTTTPTAAPGPVAAVSVEELTKVYSKAYGEIGDVDDPDRTRAIGAVLARLNATTIAPVDPEAVARDYQNAASDAVYEAGGELFGWDCILNSHRKPRVAAMRATLTAAGIPVTPEKS